MSQQPSRQSSFSSSPSTASHYDQPPGDHVHQVPFPPPNIPTRIASRHKSSPTTALLDELNHPRRSSSMTPTTPSLSNHKVIMIDDLLNQGSLAFLDGSLAFPEAAEKWGKAYELSTAEDSLDGIRKAKTLSNLGCLYRRMGFLDTNLHLQRSAWDATESYLNSLSTTDPWYQLVIRVLEWEPVRSNGFSRLSISQQQSPGGPPLPSKDGNVPSQEPGTGPPILVWALELCTNYANAFLSVGRIKDAIAFYELCRKLVDAALEEFPLPEGLDDIIHSRHPTTDNDSSSPKFYRLSFVHRKILFSKSITLSHLGSCFSHLGKSSIALRYQLSAFYSLDTIWRYVPSLFGQTHPKFRRSSSISSSTMGGQDVPHLLSKLASNVSTAYADCNLIKNAAEWLKISKELLLGSQWSDSSLRPSEILSTHSSASLLLHERKFYSRIGALYIESSRLLHNSGYRPHPLKPDQENNNAGHRDDNEHPEDDRDAQRHLNREEHAYTPPIQHSCSEQTADRGLGFLHLGGEFPLNSFDFQEVTHVLKDLTHAYMQIGKPIIGLYYFSKLLMVYSSPQDQVSLPPAVAITSSSRSFHPSTKIYLLLLFSHIYSRLVQLAQSPLNVSGFSTDAPSLSTHPFITESFQLVRFFLNDICHVDASVFDFAALTPEISLSFLGYVRDQISQMLSYRQQPWATEFLSHHLPIVLGLSSEQVGGSDEVDFETDFWRRCVLAVHQGIAREASRLALETPSCDSFIRMYWLSIAKDALVEGLMKEYSLAGGVGPTGETLRSFDSQGRSPPQSPAVFLLKAIEEHLDAPHSPGSPGGGKCLVRGYLSSDAFTFVADWMVYLSEITFDESVHSSLSQFLQVDGPTEVVQEALRVAADRLTRISLGTCYECYQRLLSQKVDHRLGQARQGTTEERTGRYEWSLVLSCDLSHSLGSRTVLPCPSTHFLRSATTDSVDTNDPPASQ